MCRWVEYFNRILIGNVMVINEFTDILPHGHHTMKLTYDSGSW